MSFTPEGYPEIGCSNCDAKDAEIERLKNLVETLIAANASFEGGTHWRNALITELAEWIDSVITPGEHGNCKTLRLLKRAREATK